MATAYKEVHQNGNSYPDPPQYNEIYKNQSIITQGLQAPDGEPKVYNGQATTIIMQPSRVPVEPQTNSYLFWSLINTLSCFFVGQWILLCSIPALIFSCKANQNLEVGRSQEAESNSKAARMFNTIATWFMIIFMVLVFIYMANSLNNQQILARNMRKLQAMSYKEIQQVEKN